MELQSSVRKKKKLQPSCICCVTAFIVHRAKTSLFPGGNLAVAPHGSSRQVHWPWRSPGPDGRSWSVRQAHCSYRSVRFGPLPRSNSPQHQPVSRVFEFDDTKSSVSLPATLSNPTSISPGTKFSRSVNSACIHVSIKRMDIVTDYNIQFWKLWKIRIGLLACNP